MIEIRNIAKTPRARKLVNKIIKAVQEDYDLGNYGGVCTADKISKQKIPEQIQELIDKYDGCVAIFSGKMDSINKFTLREPLRKLEEELKPVLFGGNCYVFYKL